MICGVHVSTRAEALRPGIGATSRGLQQHVEIWGFLPASTMPELIEFEPGCLTSATGSGNHGRIMKRWNPNDREPRILPRQEPVQLLHAVLDIATTRRSIAILSLWYHHSPVTRFLVVYLPTTSLWLIHRSFRESFPPTLPSRLPWDRARDRSQ